MSREAAMLSRPDHDGGAPINEGKRAPDATEGSPIVDRTDTSGVANLWWPLAALAIISLLLIRACVEAVPPSAQPMPGNGAAPTLSNIPR